MSTRSQPRLTQTQLREVQGYVSGRRRLHIEQVPEDGRAEYLSHFLIAVQEAQGKIHLHGESVSVAFYDVYHVVNRTEGARFHDI